MKKLPDLKEYKIDGFKISIVRATPKTFEKMLDEPYKNFVSYTPREVQKYKHFDKVYKAIGKWAVENGVECIAGPVCSGAVIAHAIAVTQPGKLENAFIPKGKYRPRQHFNYPSKKNPVIGKYIIVDDLVATGNGLREALEYAPDPVAVVILWWSGYNVPLKIYKRTKSNVFTIKIKKIRKKRCSKISHH